MKFKKFNNIIYLLLCVFSSEAQDLHFSQFNTNPALINPALTGVSAPLRASMIRRDQWGSVTLPYKTYGVSFETRMNPSGWEQVDKYRTMTFKQKSVGRIALGLSVYSDRAGDGNLGMNQANLSLASFVPISEESFFSIGIQGSFVQRKVDQSKLIYPNQYNGSVYDQNQASRESFSKTNFNYFDLASGFLWSYVQDNRLNGNKQLKANFGLSFYHINKPEQQFFNSGNRINLKYNVHGDFLASLSNRDLALAPSFLVQFQDPSLEAIAGLMFKRYFKDHSKYTGIIKRNCIGFGVYYRNKDAFILSTNLELKEQFSVNMSYDLNFSPLASASYLRGGFEMALIYKLPKPFLYQKKKGSKT